MSKLVTAYTCGVFDHFHIGHLNFIREAERFGLLTVGIQDDRDVAEGKGVWPTFPLADRLAIVGSLSYVSKVISYRNTDQSEFLRVERPTYFVVGEEYGNDERFPGQKATLATCQELGIVVQRVTRTENISSTLLRRNSQHFWDAYSHKHANDLADSITTLTQEDPEITKQEVDWILNKVGTTIVSVLELGAGDGRLTRPLADHVNFIMAVEPQEVLIKRCQGRSTPEQAARIGYSKMDALTFLKSFSGQRVYDVVLISGLLPYLSDEDVFELSDLIKRKIIANYVDSKPLIVLREPMARYQRVTVVSQASSTLDYIPYTAVYRTPFEIHNMLGMRCRAAAPERYTHPDTAIHLKTCEW